MTSRAESVRLYLVIWGWLAGLMLLGVFLSEAGVLPLPAAIIVVLVTLLSSVKAVLVALYYMHLKLDRRLLAVIALAPLLLIVLVLGVVYSSAFIRL
ncbi:MAG: cytochrome C oxidase subunit IV family protein [Candidatus Omnitrophota bacterium]|nr:cytochrome C oxidase subunit IV family protein [Candidatus Omnitrophota bacterium]